MTDNYTSHLWLLCDQLAYLISAALIIIIDIYALLLDSFISFNLLKLHLCREEGKGLLGFGLSINDDCE